MALQNALAAMQEKNLTLEKNLSAETRVKLDLFSALGEARRQLEIKDSELSCGLFCQISFMIFFSSDCLRTKDKQLEELEAKTAQLLAVMPVDTHFQMNSMAMTASSSNMDHHHHQPDTFAG